MAYGIGEVGGVVGSYYGPSLLVSHPTALMAGKITLAGVGTALVTPSALNIIDKVKSGDIGGALGESWLLGTSVAAGAAGYQHGASYETSTGLTWTERGAIRSGYAYEKNLLKQSAKYGGDTVLEVEGTKIVNPTADDILSLVNQRQIARNFGISDKNVHR